MATTYAGQMNNVAPTNPQWKACNGAPYYVLDWTQSQRTKGVLSEGNRQDYIRQVGWQGRRRGLGPLGWIVLVPYDPTGTWYVTLADDSTEVSLSSPPTVMNPPPGVK